MKISTSKVQQFTPVTVHLVCETQEELNALYAIGNASITTRTAILAGGCRHHTDKLSLNTVCEALYKVLKE